MQLRFTFSTLLLSILFLFSKAQNTSPYWSLEGNNNALSTSKLGTTNLIPLNLTTNNLTRLRIDPNGRVGVGLTTTPATLFQVGGFGAFGNRVTSANATRALNLADVDAVMRILRVHASFAPAVELISRTSADGPNMAYWDFYAEPSDKSFRIRDRVGGGAGLDRLAVSSAGNVGIGTILPSQKLHVAGNGAFDGFVGIGTAAPQYPLDIQGPKAFGRFKATDTEGWAGIILDKSASNQNEYVIHRSAGLELWVEGTIGNNDFAIRNSNSNNNSLTIVHDNNNVGIGTSTPTHKLVVTQTNKGNDAAALIQNLTTGSIYNDGLYIQAGTNSGAGSWYAAFKRPDGIQIGAISQTGPSSVSYNTASDKRLKTNIRETRFGLADVNKIQVKDYTLTGSNGEQTGFLAQQLHEVYPEAVTKGGDDPKQRPWMVDYGRITPLLVKAVQELSKENEELKKKAEKVNELEARLQKLEALLSHTPNATITSVSAAHLEQNTPNPSRGTTTIRYHIPANGASAARLTLTNSKGQLLKTINVAGSGAGQVNLDTSSLPAGVYNYTLWLAGKEVDTKHLVISR